MKKRQAFLSPMRPLGRRRTVDLPSARSRLVLSLILAAILLGTLTLVLPGDARCASALPGRGIERQVVTATIDVDRGAVLTYTDPYTTVVEVPAGAVTGTTLVTLTSLMVPRHPPTPPWTAAWVGQAFDLQATHPISRPVTATIYHYPEPARWVLLRWEANQARWRSTPTILGRADGMLVARIYQRGEFAVFRAAYHCWLLMVTRGGGP